MATTHAVQISTNGYKVIKKKSVSESNPYGKNTSCCSLAVLFPLYVFGNLRRLK